MTGGAAQSDVRASRKELVRMVAAAHVANHATEMGWPVGDKARSDYTTEVMNQMDEAFRINAIDAALDMPWADVATHFSVDGSTAGVIAFLAQCGLPAESLDISLQLAGIRQVEEDIQDPAFQDLLSELEIEKEELKSDPSLWWQRAWDNTRKRALEGGSAQADPKRPQR